MKLFTRYNRIVLGATLGLFLLSSIFYYYLLNYILLSKVDDVLNHKIVRMQRYVQQTGALPELDDMGEVKVKFLPVREPLPEVEKSFVELFDSAEMKMSPFRKYVFTLPTRGQVYQVTMVRPMAGTRNLFVTIILATMSLGFVVLLISFWINRTFLQRLWQPFYSTIAAMRSFQLGKVKEVKLAKTDIDEFAFLNDNLTETMEKAEEDYRMLKQFTENASHELQTPLAVIRSKLDMLIQQEDMSQRRSEEIREIYAEVKKLSRLNRSLLLLTKIENHQFEEAGEIDLKEKIGTKVEQMKEVWKDHDIRFQCQLQEASIWMNADLADILLNNLLSNANRHNREGGVVQIELTSHQLSICNTGERKPLNQKKIFQRFYKEQVHSDHHGLGLSIIKQVCEQWNIKITYNYKNDLHSFHLNWT
ncbi:HAMP domain-containing sensor histidine kinase [Chitinophagaceae bacterium 26-R-25]|nr:HAMP domain-containing sensor histidine kinase [Chitinophagaceae bacterium 26-R-25]